MKNQSVYKKIVFPGLVFLLLLSGFGREVQAQTDGSVKKQGVNLELADEIKSVLKSRETSWTLEREVEYSNTFGSVWTLKKKRVSVEISEFNTVEEAIERYAYVGNPKYIAVNVPIKTEKNFADQAMLRVTNLYGGSTVNFYFRQGKYTVSIWSAEKDARRFAEHILAVIKKQ